MSVLKIKTESGYASIGLAKDEEWEYGGRIQVDASDLETTVYNFAKVSEYKKVCVIRIRTSYVSTLSGTVWMGCSPAVLAGGSSTEGAIASVSNGYVLQVVELGTYGEDYNDKVWGEGAYIKIMTSNNGNSSASVSENITNIRFGTADMPNTGSTHRRWAPGRNAYWNIRFVDISKSLDGNESYVWYGVRR